MIAPGLEPEPLAFRVRPQADECFDSWIDRVAVAHDTTRSVLFRHLGIDAALASEDLVRGKCGLSIAQYRRVHHLVERLAWAVQAAPDQIETTFLEVPGAALLPRRLRRFVCARCWQEARRDGRPPIVRKEWILRMSWRCRLHDLPLSWAPGEGALAERGDAWLAAALADAARLRGGLDYRARLMAWNGACIDALLRGSRRQPRGGGLGYRERFQSNLFHFAGQRVAMLALAHSRVDQAVWGFERLMAMTVAAHPGGNGASLQPPRRSSRNWRIGRGRATPRRYEAELLDVFLAYAQLRARRDACPRG